MAKKDMIAEEAKAEGETEAMERKEHKRRRRGGGVPERDGSEKVQEYNGQGSNEMRDAKDQTPGFRRGGKMRDGGMAEGEKAGGRLDRRPRRAAGGKISGHTPYSSASAMTGPEEGGDRGFESSKPTK